MTQSTIRKEYYRKLSAAKRREFRLAICKELLISEIGLYRRMRLHCFKPVEWSIVVKYAEQNQP